MKQIRVKAVFALLAVLVFAPGLIFAQDFYVQQDGGNDLNPGDTWGQGHALATIQRAIQLAEATTESDTVHVAAASYSENIDINSGITLYGGYPSNGGTTRDPATNVTNIDGGNSGHVVTIDNVSNVVLDGFVIQNGDVTGRGGGIDIESCSSVTIHNNTVTNNTARDDWGGGIAVIGSSVTITNNTIQNNQCVGNNGSGGGISFYDDCTGTVSGNTITGNAASSDGGGMMISSADLSIANNQINNNTVTGGSGGGLYISDCPSLTITGNTISNNILSGTEYPRGAGIICSDSTVQIRRNFIQNNRGANWGGGINIYNSDGVIVNNVISGNQAISGGGIFCAQDSSAQIINNTIVGNTADSGGGVYVESRSTATATNTIVWGNSSSQLGGDGTFVVTYSDIQGGYSGTGNINSDPLFVVGGDYHLSSSSPCIDTGTSTGAPATDMAGTSRPRGQGYDMGAYEYVGVPVPDIKANDKNGSITVSSGAPVSIVLSLDPDNLSGQNVDWWVAESAPDGHFYHFDLSTGLMVQGLLPTYQGPLFSLGTTQLLNSPDLTVGTHTFYFGVDLNMNGLLDMDSIYYDSINVIVQ